MPEPFGVGALLAEVAAERGRPIELLPVRARPDAPCGLLVTTDRADYIVYAADTTPLHRQHILLHEVAHLLCGHQNASTPLAAAGALLPRLDPALVRSVLGRTVYGEPQEQEAELVASLILSRAAGRRVRPAAAGVGPGLRSLFGVAGRGGHG